MGCCRLHMVGWLVDWLVLVRVARDAIRMLHLGVSVRMRVVGRGLHDGCRVDRGHGRPGRRNSGWLLRGRLWAAMGNRGVSAVGRVVVSRESNRGMRHARGTLG